MSQANQARGATDQTTPSKHGDATALGEATLIPSGDATLIPADTGNDPLAEATIPPGEATFYPEQAQPLGETTFYPEEAPPLGEKSVRPDHETALGETTFAPDDPEISLTANEAESSKPRSGPNTVKQPAPPRNAGLPEYIGPFAVKRKLGEGAMGWVYLAEQLKPKRLVALKLIHRDVATHAFRARFEQEYQTLAGMNHDNVARIHSVGTTADGTPYFSMEYIDGSPIDAYCRQFRLPLQARLRLFLQVCDGVVHAHQRAVVHRDLKPANILVTGEDRRACAKLIDFGIAKNLKHTEQRDHLETQIGSLVGTPAYMSPEQFGGGHTPIDTRTDIYSLGVLLYQLLTDQLPLQAALFEGKSWDQCIHIYRETEPPPPSKRKPLPADQRACFNTPAVKAVRGDLDWIVAKAMSKRLEARYETVAALRGDVLNYLENRPVSAGPPSWSYHLKKTLVRHMNWVFAAVTLVTGLSVGLTMAVQSWRATEAQRARAEYLSEFLWSILESPDPRRQGREAKLVDVIDEAVNRLDDGMQTEPEIRAAIRSRLGATYTGLGSFEQAAKLLQQSLQTHRDTLGEDHLETLRTKYHLAALYSKTNQAGLALPLFENCVSARRRILGPNHVDTRMAMIYLAHTQNTLGHHSLAADTYLQNIDFENLSSRKSRTAIDETSLVALTGLATSLMMQGDWDVAAGLLDETIRLDRLVFGEEDARTLVAMHSYATCLRRLKHYAAAEPIHRQVATARSKAMGPLHPETLRAQYGIGITLWHQHRYEEAYNQFCELYQHQLALYPNQADWLRSAEMLGRSVHILSGNAAALSSFDDIWADLVRHGQTKNRYAIRIMALHADLMLDAKQWPRAADYLDEAILTTQEISGTQATLELRENLARCYFALSQPEKAHTQLQFIYNYAESEDWKKRALELAKNQSLELGTQAKLEERPQTQADAASTDAPAEKK